MRLLLLCAMWIATSALGAEGDVKDGEPPPRDEKSANEDPASGVDETADLAREDYHQKKDPKCGWCLSHAIHETPGVRSCPRCQAPVHGECAKVFQVCASCRAPLVSSDLIPKANRRAIRIAEVPRQRAQVPMHRGLSHHLSPEFELVLERVLDPAYRNDNPQEVRDLIQAIVEVSRHTMPHSIWYINGMSWDFHGRPETVPWQCDEMLKYLRDTVFSNEGDLKDFIDVKLASIHAPAGAELMEEIYNARRSMSLEEFLKYVRKLNRKRTHVAQALAKMAIWGSEPSNQLVYAEALSQVKPNWDERQIMASVLFKQREISPSGLRVLQALTKENIAWFRRNFGETLKRWRENLAEPSSGHDVFKHCNSIIQAHRIVGADTEIIADLVEAADLSTALDPVQRRLVIYLLGEIGQGNPLANRALASWIQFFHSPKVFFEEAVWALSKHGDPAAEGVFKQWIEARRWSPNQLKTLERGLLVTRSPVLRKLRCIRDRVRGY